MNVAHAAGSSRSPSITLRLTLLFAGTTFGIVLLSATVLYWSLAGSLRSEDVRLLRENALLLEEKLQRHPDRPSILQEEIVLEPATGRLEPFYARVVDSGSTVIETPRMQEVVPPALFTSGGGVETVAWRSPRGRTLLLHSIPAGERSGVRIQVALDVTHDSIILARYRRVLLAVLLVATLSAALAGLAIARRGLHPLARITGTMRKISASRLDQRMGARRWPAELADLAAVFDDMLDRLQDAFGRLTRFSADLAHELRTPLTNLRTEAEVALGRTRSGEEYRAVVESSLEEYERLTELIDRLLFLARAESGAAGLKRRPIAAEEEAAAVVDFYSALAEDTGVILGCSGRASLQVDPTFFRRALGNLVSNALAHTSRGGEVRVRIRDAERQVLVEVTDTGCGIAPEHLPRLTDRFYRVDPARTSNGAGAGLGLSLVRTIAELHGGSLELTSETGVGTTATLMFPRDV